MIAGNGQEGVIVAETGLAARSPPAATSAGISSLNADALLA